MMPPTATPGQMASLAQSMARNAEGKEAQMFQRIALVSMGVMAFASVAQVAIELLKKKPPCREEHGKYADTVKHSPRYDRDESARHQR